MSDVAASLPSGEVERIRSLRALEILDTLPEQAYDDLTLLASQVCGTPVALVSLVDANRQWFKSKVGFASSEVAREGAFCTHAIQDPHRLFEIEDAQTDPRFAESTLVRDTPNIRFYAGAPIVNERGEALGTVCVIDVQPRRLNDAQRACLTALARQASKLLALRGNAITAERQAQAYEKLSVEARLRQHRSDDLLDLVLRGDRMGLWDLHVPTGRWTLNEYGLAMLGHANDASLWEAGPYATLLHEDDRARLAEAMRRHLEDGVPFYEVTHRLRHADGHWVWVLERGVVVERDEQQRPVHAIGTHVDVTALRESDEQRRRALERLELALAGGDMGLWDWDVTTGRVVRNRQWTAMLGYSHEETEREDGLWDRIVHPDDRDAALAVMDRHLRGEVPMYETEVRLRHRDGHWLWMLDRAKVVERDADGRPLRVVGTHMNITERKRDAMALARATDMLERTGRMAHVGGWEVDIETRQVTWTDEVWRIHELEREGNPDLDRALDFYVPESRAILSAALESAMREGTAYDLELQLVTAKGRPIWVRAICVSERVGGRIGRVFGTVQDVTDRKHDVLALARATETLERTGRMARVGGWEIDLQTGKVTWSHEVYRIHEREPGDDPDLSDAIRSYAPEDQPMLTAAVEAAMREGKPFDIELRMTTAKGRAVWVRSMGVVERAADGSIARVYGTVQEITDRKRVEQALVASERRIRTITDNLPALVAHIDRDQRYTFVNAHLGRYLGKPAEEVVGRTLAEVREPMLDQILPHVDAALAGRIASFEVSAAALGRDYHVHTYFIPDVGVDGEVNGFYAMTLDITARKQAELQRAESEERLRGITDNLPALIVEFDPAWRIRFCNGASRTWLGLDPLAMVDRPAAETLLETRFSAHESHLHRAFSGEKVSFEETAQLLVGRRHLQTTYLPHYDGVGQVAGVYGMTSDITELKEIQRRLDAQARIDPLTGLANRRQFEERVAEAMARTLRTRVPMAVVLLDVDRFKAINDSLGHPGGDAVLKEFAERLGSVVRKTDLVARFAGDEFVVVLENLASEDEAGAIAAKMVAAVRPPFTVDGAPWTVTTSAGFATFEGGDQTVAELLSRADGALYAAKSGGRDRVAAAA